MDTRSRGNAGEALAAAYYQQKGCCILARNFRVREGEIDLILREGATLVFAEVKARSQGSIASPREWVDTRKQRRIIAAAGRWLEQHPEENPMRFDVVEVFFLRDGSGEVNCIENAFML